MIRIVSCVALISILSLSRCEGRHNSVADDDYQELRAKIDESLRVSREKLEWVKQFRIEKQRVLEKLRIRIKENEKMKNFNRPEQYLASSQQCFEAML